MVVECIYSLPYTNNMLASTNKIKKKSSNSSGNKPTNWYFIIDYYLFCTMGDMTKKPINVIMTRKIFLRKKIIYYTARNSTKKID